ncbi:Oleate-induced peroxisomal protein POX18 [Cladobotryum mycophilum]|uniref:Oleate-induced peroxisomal protein POX18 n=1 Tax=Cladobotryum mycophilum TaxID=491253 RepID=A0ABR0S4R8_9HYPO
MSVKNDSFPASAAFDLLNNSLQDESNKKAALGAKSIFVFTLKNTDGKEESWTLDLKTKAAVTTGAHKKPTATLILSDEDFGKLAAGQANAQKLYMGNKMKIKGNLMSTMKLEPILKKAQDKPKL